MSRLGRILRLACIILALAAVAAPPPAHAQGAGKPAEPAADEEKTDPIDAAMAVCIDKDPSTAGMLSCATTAEGAWDKALNQAYQSLLKELPSGAQASLREAQRAWITQREREFRLQEQVHGLLQGTMWGPVMADHRVTHVKNRALQLRAYLEALADGRP